MLCVLCMQIYNEKRSQFEIKRNNPKDLVERVARDISKLLNSKRKALEVSINTSVYKRTLNLCSWMYVLDHWVSVHALFQCKCFSQLSMPVL